MFNGKESPGTVGADTRARTNRQSKNCTTGAGLSIKFIEQALKAGLSVIPTSPETKKPLVSWRAYQAAPMSQQQAQSFAWPGLAIITGRVSGNTECLDFDFQAKWFEAWADIVEAEAPGLLPRLTRQKTQSGGKHVVYRCPGVEIAGNTKLASDKEGACYIETRGEGGYFLAAPTPGYVLENGTFTALPEITLGERETLLRAARALNLHVRPKYHKQPTVDGDRPGDIYDKEADPRPLLEKHGWKIAGSRGDFEHWTRPGKDRGISASLIDEKNFYVFTSNAPPLEPGTGYTPFSLFATLEHRGNFEAAVKDLWMQGYRSKSTSSTPPDPPEPLPDELLPVAPFSFALLPDTLRPWAEDVCERMQCPPDFIGAGIMAALAGVIGRQVAIRPQGRTDWTVTPNLWALVVGRPGVLKSPALEQALAPIKFLTAEAAEKHQQDAREYEVEAMAAKLRKEAAEKQARKILEKTPDADLSTVLAVADPAAPQLKRYVVNDTSPASLGELLRQNPNGLLVFRDEIVSLLKSLDREGQEEGRGFYLTAWNGDSPYTFDRIGRGLNLHIPAVCLSVLGGTQPGRLSEYVRNAVKGGAADDGLIQRFGLLVWPDTNGAWRDVDRWPDRDAKAKALKVFDRLASLDPWGIGAEQDTDADGAPDGPPYLRFEPTALELFQEWRASLENRLRGELHPALESHFAKYRKLIPSIALIIHLADGGTGSVSERAIKQALAWGEYLETHAQRAYGSISQPEIAVAKEILNRIKKGDLKTGFSSRDVWRPGWSKLSDRDQVKDGLQLLEDYNHLYRKKSEGTGGRPRTVYHVNQKKGGV